jgi:threonyl-tRNA synthetase
MTRFTVVETLTKIVLYDNKTKKSYTCEDLSQIASLMNEIWEERNMFEEYMRNYEQILGDKND